MENLDNKKLARKLARKCREHTQCHLKENCIFNLKNNHIEWCTEVRTQDWLKIFNFVDKLRNGE